MSSRKAGRRNKGGERGKVGRKNEGNVRKRRGRAGSYDFEQTAIGSEGRAAYQGGAAIT